LVFDGTLMKTSQSTEVSSVVAAEAGRLGGLSISEKNGGTVLANQALVVDQKSIWKLKNYGTLSGAAAVDTESQTTAQSEQNGTTTVVAGDSTATLSRLFKGSLLSDFTVDNSTYSLAQIRATFYPKFENEKSDQEVRIRMIEMVSKGLATLEVSLKHSGSLFMYAGNEGGAYAKNSFGNVYTAVGVFVLGRMFQEAWGVEATKKQAEFNDFLERNHTCISMELVTAVLGDHGQRPHEDYVVVTAVTELGSGKPKFYSTPDIIAFCRKWRLPTNHVWLFSTRKSVTSFFAAYDALCEEGTAATVCKALDDVADISVPGSKDHIKVQGEILEGLVARIVSHKSSKHMEQVLKDFPPPPAEGADHDLGPSLREICAANQSDEKQQIKALLQSVGPSFCPTVVDWFGDEANNGHSRNADRSVVSKFLQAHPADFTTTKLQEMIRLMREKRFPANFKCSYNFHKLGSVSLDNLYLKMVIHVHSDSAFRRYQKEMRHRPGLWPLYRGFFIDINLFKANKERAAEIATNAIDLTKTANCSDATSGLDGLANEDANLMIKLKFLTYKLRTFLIRNGLSILFKEGPAAYKSYYLRAVYIRRKCGNKQLSSATYLSEAEPFLEQYAKSSPGNQALIGSAGNFVRAEDFLAIVEGGRDEEGDLEPEREVAPTSPSHSTKDTVPKAEGLIIFFPGIPGCAKSALCKEILAAPGGLGDDRPINTLMGDLIKGRYWQKVAEERRKQPKAIMLADKNAPNEEVWRQIEDMCRATRASAVPVVPDSEGTDSNPFSLDALAVFIFRVLQRVNHPGNLDSASPNAGYVLLMFYHLYEGKSRKEFEAELVERFGSIVKMPLLKTDSGGGGYGGGSGYGGREGAAVMVVVLGTREAEFVPVPCHEISRAQYVLNEPVLFLYDRKPLPDSVKSIFEEGMNLYGLHTSRHGRLESTKGSYSKEWAKWETQLRVTLFGNADYLNSVQVPFDFAVKHVLEQLQTIARGDYVAPSSERRKFGTILAMSDAKIEAFLKDTHLKDSLKKAHVTLAHKRSHGVTAVASYGLFLNQEVPVDLIALLFSDKMAAFGVELGSIDGEKVNSKNQWPHITIWTGEGVSAKEANTLPQLLSEGKAKRVVINPPTTITGMRLSVGRERQQAFHEQADHQTQHYVQIQHQNAKDSHHD
ncbi:tRNA ligase, phosphodiesterase, partial [Dillenia turbinata]